MSILKIKDNNGNWISIPAIKGEPGEATPEYIQMYEEVAENAQIASAKAQQATEERERIEELDVYTKQQANNIFAMKTDLNGYAPLDASRKIPNEYLYGKTIKEYGVRWNGTSSTACERLGDAVGLVANAHLGSADAVVNDFNNIYPWSDIRLCNLDENGNVLAYIGEPNFARDGSNGDVMVEIPKFYYKRRKVGIVEEWWICELPIGGYELHPLFIDGGIEMSKAYISAYNLSESADGTKGQSISGAAPLVRKTRAQFRTLARAKGSIWSIEDASSANARQMLYMIEYANTNSQSKLGNGISSCNYTTAHIALEPRTASNEFVLTTAQANAYVVGQRIEIGTSLGNNNKTATPRTILSITPDAVTEGQSIITFDGDPIDIAVGNVIWNVAPFNGECDILNGESGYIGTNGKNDVSYRGIEGFHGKLHCFIDGININDRIVYYCNKMSSYADDVWDGDYNQIGYVNSDADGYVSELGYDANAPWIMFPVAAEGGSSTYIPDRYYQDAGKRLTLLGGLFSSGTAAGVFCWYCYGTFSHSNVYSGARLLVKKP